jgi:hypothetical protein
MGGHPVHSSNQADSLWRHGYLGNHSLVFVSCRGFRAGQRANRPGNQGAFPLYILTFGLISFVINGALLIFVAWLSQLWGNGVFTIYGLTKEGLTIESLGWAILGSIVMSITAFVGRALFKTMRLL